MSQLTMCTILIAGSTVMVALSAIVFIFLLVFLSLLCVKTGTPQSFSHSLKHRLNLRPGSKTVKHSSSGQLNDKAAFVRGDGRLATVVTVESCAALLRSQEKQ